MPSKFIRLEFSFRGRDFFIDVAATGVTEYCNIRLNLIISTLNNLQKAIVKARTDFDLSLLTAEETLEVYTIIQDVIKSAIPRAFFIVNIDKIGGVNA